MTCTVRSRRLTGDNLVLNAVNTGIVAAFLYRCSVSRSVKITQARARDRQSTQVHHNDSQPL